jgi:hypothetical protein
MARFWPSLGLRSNRVRPRRLPWAVKAMVRLPCCPCGAGACSFALHQDAPLPSWSAPFDPKAPSCWSGRRRKPGMSIRSLGTFAVLAPMIRPAPLSRQRPGGSPLLINEPSCWGTSECPSENGARVCNGLPSPPRKRGSRATASVLGSLDSRVRGNG